MYALYQSAKWARSILNQRKHAVNLTKMATTEQKEPTGNGKTNEQKRADMLKEEDDEYFGGVFRMAAL